MKGSAPNRALMSRRQLFRLAGAGAAVFYLETCASMFRWAGVPVPVLPPAFAGPDALGDFGPIDRTIGELAPARFSGDDPERPHRAFTDFRGWLASHGGKLPAPDEKVAVAVVGGGIGGLVACHLLREHRPVLLEQAARFGGNSRGESWHGIDYSIGAAYFAAPDEGSPLDVLYREIGLEEIWRAKPEGDPAELGGKIHQDFWAGATAPETKGQFEALHRYCRDVLEGSNDQAYPDIPVEAAEDRAWIDELDRLTFREHLVDVLGGPLHPHLSTALEHYCWSSFGASFSEIGAASGLNFFASELGEILVTPGGNAAVAERLLRKLAAALPEGHLRPSSLVVRVKVVADGVEVAWEDGAGRLRCLHAQAVVLACPKFIAAKVLEGLEPERKSAIGKLDYNAYLVGNVMLNKGIPDSFYDLYLLGDGKMDPEDIRASSENHRVTDVVLGTYASPDPDRTVLTLYRGMPYEGGRADVYEDGAFAKARKEFEEQVHRGILPLFGLKPEDVADLRIARWGHPMPVARAGLIADGIPERLRKPFRERVFFVNQDNWALPSLECTATEAILQAPDIERVLRGG